MVKQLLSRLFGSLSGQDRPAKAVAAPAAPVASEAAIAVDPARAGDPTAFVEFVVKSLVDSPDEVSVNAKDDDRGTLIQISCRKEEVGRVIGKKGKTIEAIRSLVKAGAARNDRKVSVVVAEQ